MGVKTCRMGWTSLLGIAVTLGCSSKSSERPTADEQGAVRERFAELQAALKDRDAEKLWVLLDAKSRTDAERAAKNIQRAYNQAGAEEKVKQEEALGLSGTELAGLDGKGFLKTKRFQKKYQDVPNGKIDQVVIQGENATVHFLDLDGDHEKAVFLRQDGQWKAWLPMPRVSQP